MPAETKTKKAGAKGQGTSCLLTPAYAATDPPDAFAGLPLVSSSVVFSCGVRCGSNSYNASPPDLAVMSRNRSRNDGSILRSLGYARKLWGLRWVCGQTAARLRSPLLSRQLAWAAARSYLSEEVGELHARALRADADCSSRSNHVVIDLHQQFPPEIER